MTSTPHCLLCGEEPAIAVMVVSSEPADAVALPSNTHVGGTCLALFVGGEDVALAQRLSDDFADLGREDVVALLHRRAGPPAPLTAEAEPVRAARRDGYVALHDHTGISAELGSWWPPAHRLSRSDLGEHVEDPDERWLVRSPWGALAVEDVVALLVDSIEREPYAYDLEVRRARVREVFELSEDEAGGLL